MRRFLGIAVATAVVAGHGDAQKPPIAAGAAIQRGVHLIDSLRRVNDMEALRAAVDSLTRLYPSQRGIAVRRILLGGYDGADAAADSLFKANPTDPWSAYAYASRREFANGDYSTQTVLSAAWRRSHNDTIAALKVDVLAYRYRYKEAIAFADSALRVTPRSAVLRVAKADALWGLLRVDSLARPRTRQLYLEASQLDPLNTSAFISGNDDGSPDSLVALLRIAIQMQPMNYALHRRLWNVSARAVRLSPDERKALVSEDAASVLRSRPSSRNAMFQASRAYAWIGDSVRARELRERIERDWPTSREAHAIARAVAGLPPDGADIMGADRRGSPSVRLQSAATATDTMRLRQEEARLLWAYLARKDITPSWTIPQAMTMLINLALIDSTVVPADSIIGLAERVDRDPDGYDSPIMRHDLPIFLARRGVRLDLARRLALRWDAEHRASVGAMRAGRPNSSSAVEAEKDYRAARASVLGYLLLAGKQLDSARQELARGLAARPRDSELLRFMGMTQEAMGRPDSARAYYRKGAVVEGKDHESAKDLARLVGTRNVDSLVSAVRSDRRLEIVNDRTSPKPVSPISLRDLDDRVVDATAFKGKVTVIHVWGIWCVPCVAEIKSVEDFFRRYKGDTSVVVLTIATERRDDEVSAFMRSRGLTFPVLVDSPTTWSTKNVGAYPTTLFLDSNGQVVYRQLGESWDLVNEFSWRVEAMKKEPR